MRVTHFWHSSAILKVLSAPSVLPKAGITLVKKQNSGQIPDKLIRLLIGNIHPYPTKKIRLPSFFQDNLVPIRVVLSMTDEYWLTDASFSINS